MSVSFEFAEAIQNKFIAVREERFAAEAENPTGKPLFGIPPERLFNVIEGRTYDKIVSVIPNNEYGASVHAFVERSTGKLLKAGSWKAPQRDKDGPAYRWDLSTPEGFNAAVNAADWAGGYLYK